MLVLHFLRGLPHRRDLQTARPATKRCYIDGGQRLLALSSLHATERPI